MLKCGQLLKEMIKVFKKKKIQDKDKAESKFKDIEEEEIIMVLM